MATEMSLKALPRDGVPEGGLGAMRRGGHMPAVVYGHGVESTPIELEQASFAKLWRTAGTGHMIQLSVKGEARARRVLIREVQIAPRTGRLLHADLYQVNPKEKIHTEVPVVLSGEPPLVVLHEAQLVHGPDRLRIECLPDDLPDNFTVDITQLREMSDAIRVSDLEVPRGVTILNEPDTLIATLSSKLGAREQPEEEEVAAAEEGAEAIAAEGEGEPAAE